LREYLKASTRSRSSGRVASICEPAFDVVKAIPDVAPHSVAAWTLVARSPPVDRAQRYTEERGDLFGTEQSIRDFEFASCGGIV
jgi:hypothetical protein